MKLPQFSKPLWGLPSFSALKVEEEEGDPPPQAVLEIWKVLLFQENKNLCFNYQATFNYYYY